MPPVPAQRTLKELLPELGKHLEQFTERDKTRAALSAKIQSGTGEEGTAAERGALIKTLQSEIQLLQEAIQMVDEFRKSPAYRSLPAPRQNTGARRLQSQVQDEAEPFVYPDEKSDISLPHGTRCAALVNPEDTNACPILCTVVRFKPERDRYLVEDREKDRFGRHPRFEVSYHHVYELPYDPQPTALPPGRPSNPPPLRAGDRVLAVYPDTTELHPCVIRSLNPTDKIAVVAFENDMDQTRNVPFADVARKKS